MVSNKRIVTSLIIITGLIVITKYPPPNASLLSKIIKRELLVGADVLSARVNKIDL